jgi:hypothetical protein
MIRMTADDEKVTKAVESVLKKFGPQIERAEKLFEGKSIDAVLLDSGGFALIVDDEFCLFFYKRGGELYYDGWEVGRIHKHYWQDLKGKKI